MLEDIIIRKISIKDVDILNRLFESLLIYEKNNFDENIKENISITSYFNKRVNDENSIVLVSVIDDMIVGYISGYVDSDNKIKEEIEVNIDSLFVVDKYRNNGIGAKLINKFIKYSKKIGAKYITIDNFVDNTIAKYLYNKLGFNVVKESRRKLI